MPTNLQVLLARRPTGPVEEADFRLVESPLPEPNDGELLVRNHYLSLDPYMRGRMVEGRSYAPPVALGAVMVGGTVGEVVASRDPRFAVGDLVVGNLGWQQYGLARGDVMRVDPARVPLPAYLGAAGMPGVTAWVGLLDIAAPKRGETVVVSAAAGAVGSIAGQLAKLQGCRTVGIAGGAAKCAHVTGELGFDACVDYRAADLVRLLDEATPGGIDVYFDNVGGAVLEAVLTRMKPFSRIAMCGAISEYGESAPHGVTGLRSIVSNRIRVQGFIVTDHLARWPEVREQLVGLVANGKIRQHATVAQGLESAPRAFIGMLHGENLGKQLVKLV